MDSTLKQKSANLTTSVILEPSRMAMLSSCLGIDICVQGLVIIGNYCKGQNKYGILQAWSGRRDVKIGK